MIKFWTDQDRREPLCLEQMCAAFCAELFKDEDRLATVADFTLYLDRLPYLSVTDTRF